MKNSKKIFFKIIIITILFVCFYSPVLAQVDDYTLLTPLPTIDSKPSLSNYLSGMFELAIAISAVLAFAMITWGGILYATSDAMSKTEKGREYITNAIYGLVLVIGAWAILNTINPKILQFNLNFDIEKFANPTATVSTGEVSGYTAGGGKKLPGYKLTPEQVAEDKAIRDDLWNKSASGGKIHVNTEEPCTNGETKGCTNLVGLPDTAIMGLKKLNANCNCEILITGGTEGGHVSHGPGIGNVDLAVTDKLSTFIYQYGGTPVKVSFGTQYKMEINGKMTTFTKETSPLHWHVSF